MSMNGTAITSEPTDMVVHRRTPRGTEHNGRTPSRSLSKSERVLLGVWTLVDSYDELATGEILPSRGAIPTGILMYDSNRRMAVQVMNDGRPKSISRNQSVDSVRAILDTYTAYFGVFEVDEAKGCVLHHIEGHLCPEEVGTTRIRFYQVTNGVLVLTTPPFSVHGSERVRKIIWKHNGGAV